VHAIEALTTRSIDVWSFGAPSHAELHSYLTYLLSVCILIQNWTYFENNASTHVLVHVFNCPPSPLWDVDQNHHWIWQVFFWRIWLVKNIFCTELNFLHFKSRLCCFCFLHPCKSIKILTLPEMYDKALHFEPKKRNIVLNWSLPLLCNTCNARCSS